MKRKKPPPSAPGIPPTAGLAKLAPYLVVVVTVLAFLPVLGNGFVGWDDDRNFINNTHYRGLGPAQLRWMFTSFHMGHYIPLTWLTLGFDYVLWGMRPVGYHVTTVLLHAGAVVVFYQVARRLLSEATGRPETQDALVAGALAAALVFGVHPLRAESVAWATERRDVLSGLLALLVVRRYLRGQRGPATWVLYACALLSKSMVATLPVVLLVLDVYPLRRLGGDAGWWNDRVRLVYLEKLPFFALAAATSAVAMVALAHIHGGVPLAILGIGDRLAITAYSLAFYLAKTLLPFGLSPIYQRPEHIDAASPTFVASYLLVVALVALGIARRRRWPALLPCLTVYLVVLLPVSGIVQNGPQIAADRYTYLSCMPWALLGGLAVTRLHPRRGALVAAGALVAVLAILCAQQTARWRDSLTLWMYAASVQPDSWIALNNRGLSAGPHGSPSAIAQYNLGLSSLRAGNRAGAEAAFREALRLNPVYTDAHNNLGNLLASRGQFDEAEKHFREAADDSRPEAFVNLANVLLQKGDFRGALVNYKKALKTDPQNATAHANLGHALRMLGNIEAAVAEFQEALKIDPGLEVAARSLMELQSGR